MQKAGSVAMSASAAAAPKNIVLRIFILLIWMKQKCANKGLVPATGRTALAVRRSVP
jgi:hypothetical protein